MMSYGSRLPDRFRRGHENKKQARLSGYTLSQVMNQMTLRGRIRGRTIELEQEPPLPDGTPVEVELRPSAAEPLFERLYALWRLTSTEPLPSLQEACQQAAQALVPKKASQLIQAMRQE